MAKTNAPPKILMVKLSLMDPMPGNREFGSGKDKKSIKELGDSINEHGIKNALLLRPHPEKKGRFQIVNGCRRHDAAELVGLTEAPSIIEEIPDKEALELRLIENVQRVGIHEMEEAKGYQELLDLRDDKGAAPHTVTTISQRTGKSEAYIYARLKLLRMPDVAQEAFLKGKLNASVALLLCRIPDPKMAHKAALQVLDHYGSGYTAEREKRAADPECEALSFRAAKELIQRDYMRRLKGAKFDQEDPDLVPVVYEQPLQVSATGLSATNKDDKGAVDAFKARDAVRNGHGERLCGGKCSDCPFRTGNMKKLAPDLVKMVEEGEGASGSTDVCTNTACFQMKEKATVKAEQAKFKDKGQQLLTENQAKRVLSYDGTRLDATDQYIDLRAEVPGKKGKTWEDVLEPHLPEGTTPLVARGKKTFLLLDVETAAAAAKKASVKFEKPEPRPNRHDPEQQRIEDEKREKRRAFAAAVQATAYAALEAALPKAKPEQLLRFVIGTHSNEYTLLGQKEELDDKKYAQALDKMSLIDLAVTLAINNFPDCANWQGELEEEFAAACKEFGVDLKAIIEAEGKKQKQAEAEAAKAKEAEAKAKEATAKAEPKKEKPAKK